MSFNFFVGILINLNFLGKSLPYGDFLEYNVIRLGRVAQLVRAPRLHRGGQGFESLSAHNFKTAFRRFLILYFRNSLVFILIGSSMVGLLFI